MNNLLDALNSANTKNLNKIIKKIIKEKLKGVR